MHVCIATEYWIALDDRDEEGVFVWSLTGQPPAYTAWQSDQQDCGVIAGDLGWNDYGCDRTRYPLCEYEN